MVQRESERAHCPMRDDAPGTPQNCLNSIPTLSFGAILWVEQGLVIAMPTDT